LPQVVSALLVVPALLSSTPERLLPVFFVSWMLLPQEPVEDRSSQPTDAKETVLVCITSLHRFCSFILIISSKMRA